MPSPLHFFMSDLLLNVHSVTAATIVVDNARSSQKTTLPAASMSSTINHSCSRWECRIEQPISILPSSTTHSSASTSNDSLSSDDRSSLPPLQRRAPLVVSNHSIPTCPKRQLSRDISISDDDGNDEISKEQQDPHRPSIATISMYALPTTPSFEQARLRIKISPPRRDTIDASSIGEDAMISRPIRRHSETLGVYTVTSQAPTCPVRRQSPSPRYAAPRLPMMDEERDSSMDIVPPMPPFLTSRTSISSVSSSESDAITADRILRGPRHGVPPIPPFLTSRSTSISSVSSSESDASTADRILRGPRHGVPPLPPFLTSRTSSISSVSSSESDVSKADTILRGPRHRTAGGILLLSPCSPVCAPPPPPPGSEFLVHHKQGATISSSSPRSVLSSGIGDRQYY